MTDTVSDGGGVTVTQKYPAQPSSSDFDMIYMKVPLGAETLTEADNPAPPPGP
jgi:hypothetical protein